MGSATDEAEAVIVLILGIAVFLIFGLVALLLYFAITGVIVLVQYRVFYAEAEREYDQIVDELTAGIDTDTAFHAVFGDGAIPPLREDGNSVDWFEETILGEKMDHAA